MNDDLKICMGEKGVVNLKPLILKRSMLTRIPDNSIQDQVRLLILEVTFIFAHSITLMSFRDGFADGFTHER